MPEATKKPDATQHRARRAIQAGVRAYRSAALFLCNTLVLLIVLNALLSGLFRAKDALFPEITPGASAYHERLASVYPGLSLPEIRDLMAETWGRRVAYDPFAQFREPPFAGKYVNVHEAGFRAGADQGPWPPDKREMRVFMFGGSTLFGYGVRDEDTIGSQLQRYLRDRLKRKVSVYNFGQGSYFSTQERAFWEQLLLAGQSPDLAVFVDGLNEFCQYNGEPAWSQAMRDFVNRQSNQWSQPWISQTALARLAVGIRNRMGHSPEDAAQDAGAAADPHVEPGLLESVCERYLGNKRLIEATAAAYGVPCAFVWQPIPTYHYDLSRHLFLREGIAVPHRYAAPGYALMATRRDDKRLGRNFLWLADMQQGRQEPLYVDQVHYTAGFSKTVAEAIGDWLLADGPLKPSGTHP